MQSIGPRLQNTVVFLRSEEIMSDVKKGSRSRVIELPNACLEMRRVSSW